ncbi:putative GATA transcription factor 22 [Typha angustifolia]|uniref:putative GATA transcription factor 22 n=1 Tax=Typha angustifolia TaxID=59011 RepID=UPI003C3074A1
MTTFYMSQFGPIPMEGGDQDQSHLPLHDVSAPYPFLMNTAYDQEASEGYHHLKQQVVTQEEPADERLLCDRYIRENNLHGSGKWVPSKMRFIKKMTNSSHIGMSKPRRSNTQLHHDDQSNNTSNSPTGIIRVCSDCNTTKTPLWRSGPHGPKSLCNACGIRQRKARRAAMASGLIPTDARSKVRREEKAEVDRTVPFKKRFKIPTSSTAGSAKAKRDVCFKGVTISLGKNSAFHRVFPQDERDAAILLMALSCGLACS